MIKLEKLSNLIRNSLVVFLATIFVVSIAYAATTIGSDITTAGTLTVTGAASTTSATSTAYLQVGGGAASYALFNYAVGDAYIADDLEVDDDVNIGGDVTIVGGLVSVNAATTTDSLKIGGYASTTGDLIVGGGTIDLNTSTATTTPGIFARDNGVATSTLSAGSIEGTDTVVGCLELVASDGLYYYCNIDGAGTGLQCAAGRCKD